MAKKMLDKHKFMAYVLNKEFGYSMTKIGELMGVVQSTISAAIKEVEYRKQIANLERELDDARLAIEDKGYIVLNVIELPDNKV